MQPFVVRRAALALPSEDRAALAAELLASLDEDGGDLASDTDWDAAWGDELEARADQLDRGDVETVAADEVFADARRRRAARR
jgi:putative addiction module component (TIGR02574 family)